MKNIGDLSPTEDGLIDLEFVTEHSPQRAIKKLLESQLSAISSLGSVTNKIAAASIASSNHLREGSGRIVYVGAGSSIRLGVQDGIELWPTFGWPIERIRYLVAGGEAALLGAVEGAEDDVASGQREAVKIGLGDADVVIGITASGNTPFTCAVMRIAKETDALTIGITSNPEGKMNDLCSHLILTKSGSESLLGSTRLSAGTLQKIVLNLLSTHTMMLLGRTFGNAMIYLRPSNNKLCERQLRLLTQLVNIDDKEGQALLESVDWNLPLALLKTKGLSLKEAQQAIDKEIPFNDLWWSVSK